MKISIKYKLLTVLVSLPLVTIVTYVYLLTDIFKQDKIAYIFDSGVSITGSLSAQFNSKMNGLLGSSRMLMEGYNEEGNNFSLAVRSYFKGQSEIDRLFLIDVDKNEVVSKLTKDSTPYGQFVRSDEEVLVIGNKMGKGIKLQKAGTSEGLFWLKSEITNSGSSNRYQIVSLCNFSDLIETFHQSKTYINVVYDIESSKIIYSTNKKIDFSSWDIADKLIKMKSKAMTFQSEGDDSGRYLVAASRTSLSSLLIVSMVERDKAFLVIKAFVKKTVLFLIIVIALAVLISLIASGKLTDAFRKLNEATSKVAKGDFDISLNIKTGDEVEELAENFNIMGEKVSQLMSEVKDKARMELELQTAQRVQNTLFPESDITIDDFQISGYSSPASECGGDWWHYHDRGDKLYLWIGDVTGHGASAALMTSAVTAAVEMVLSAKNMPAKMMFDLINRSLMKVSGGNIYITIFMGIIDKSTGKMTYCNAGHEPPLIFRKDEKYSKKNIIPLTEVNGPRLCQKRDTEYEETTIQLEKSDTILFYTDGITEAANSEGTQYTEGRLLRTTAKALNSTGSLKEVREEMLGSVNSFIGETPLDDDMTYFFCRYLA